MKPLILLSIITASLLSCETKDNNFISTNATLRDDEIDSLRGRAARGDASAALELARAAEVACNDKATIYWYEKAIHLGSKSAERGLANFKKQLKRMENE